LSKIFQKDDILNIMSSILYLIKNVPGTWQWWADAAESQIWLVPENSEAQTYAQENAKETAGYILVKKTEIRPLTSHRTPTIF
jgi:hypothetical protein